MEKMPGHPRLYRRGAVYYHRAAIPVDIADTYPKTEETFSLKTKDYQQALKIVRVAAVQVDRLFDEHRRKLKDQTGGPVLKELTNTQIKQLGNLYYAMLLDEDEEVRMRGFDEEPLPTILMGKDIPPEILKPLTSACIKAISIHNGTFEEREEDHEWLEEVTRHDFARGIISDHFVFEADDILTWDGVDINLDKKSPSRRKLARELQAVTIRASEVKRQRNEGQVIETPAFPAADSTKSATPMLSQAVEDWITEKSRTSWVEKTAREYRVWVEHFISMSGDKPLEQYSKADGRAFKTMLLKLPANWNKYDQLKHLDIAGAAERAQKLGMKPMADRNVNKLLQFVGSFWNWAAQHYDDCPTNPFTGLSIKIRKRAREERDPFTTEDLQTIFTAPIYTGCQSLHHWSAPGDLIPRDAGIFWVPLISLFSGARAGEIIQLYVHDVKEEEGIWFFDINGVEADKHVKNASSWRKIPIHQMLRDIGLLQHVETRKRQGESRLFPDLERGKDGHYSSPFSKHFGRFLKAVGVKSNKNAFHSFRHSFEDACRNSEIPEAVMNALQGHSQAGMAGRYGSGFAINVLAEEMKKLKYANLDLTHLRQTN